MKGIEEFLHWLQGTMKVPTWFGWYHIMWICFMVAACVLIYIFRKKFTKKGINITLLTIGTILIVLEIYKQVIYSFNYNGGGGNSSWSYQWYAFPFQFCSTPMYLMVLAGIFRKGKVYDCIISYLGIYTLFAGLTVMIYPGDVFAIHIGINFQTMFWHSSMFVIGFLLLATRSVKFEFKTILKATIVFLIMVGMALIMNILFHFYGNGANFNMFLISPYLPCTLVVLDVIYKSVPYVIFLLIYVIGFMLAASVMMAVAILLDRLEKSIKTRKMFPDEIAAEKAIEIIKKEL